MNHADVRSEFGRSGYSLLSRLVSVFEGVAFWTAATFPFAHVGALLLYARGSLSITAIGVLAALHAAAIVAGHGHNRTEVEDE